MHLDNPFMEIARKSTRKDQSTFPGFVIQDGGIAGIETPKKELILCEKAPLARPGIENPPESS